MKKMLLSTLAISVLSVSSVNAETSNQEFAAINKIASLCQSFKSSGIKVGVVYSPSNAESVKDKDSIISFDSSAVGVDIANVSSSDANLLILAGGLSLDDQSKVSTAVSGKQVITASTDLSCVESGKCMLGVDVGSVVKLLVDSNSYKNSGLKFDPAFEFMVKQI